jgi:hypothetical protein
MYIHDSTRQWPARHLTIHASWHSFPASDSIGVMVPSLVWCIRSSVYVYTTISTNPMHVSICHPYSYIYHMNLLSICPCRVMFRHSIGSNYRRMINIKRTHMSSAVVYYLLYATMHNRSPQHRVLKIYLVYAHIHRYCPRRGMLGTPSVSSCQRPACVHITYIYEGRMLYCY